MRKGTPEDIAQKREEIINACEQLTAILDQNEELTKKQLSDLAAGQLTEQITTIVCKQVRKRR